MSAVLDDNVYAVRYPFVRERGTEQDEAGVGIVERWRPGTLRCPVPPQDVEALAHGEGQMLLEVVSLHTPPGYPTRVFYTRRWRDPDGVEFGRKCLRVTTVGHFARLLRGYRFPYALREAAP